MPRVADAMETQIKMLAQQLEKALSENIQQSQLLQQANLEIQNLRAREVEIVANANSAAKAEVAGEVAKAFRDGLAYGKDLFREIRAIH